MNFVRVNQYRYMWLFVFFDLPSETRLERKVATKFRKDLLKNGFEMFQFSIYTRFCSSSESAETHTKRVKSVLPEKGKVGMMRITDKQFGMIELFHGLKKERIPSTVQQLELF